MELDMRLLTGGFDNTALIESTPHVRVLDLDSPEPKPHVKREVISIPHYTTLKRFTEMPSQFTINDWREVHSVGMGSAYSSCSTMVRCGYATLEKRWPKLSIYTKTDKPLPPLLFGKGDSQSEDRALLIFPMLQDVFSRQDVADAAKMTRKTGNVYTTIYLAKGLVRKSGKDFEKVYSNHLAKVSA